MLVNPVGAGLLKAWRKNYAEDVSSNLGDEYAWRALSADELERAVSQLTGARSLPSLAIAAVARTFQVRADRPVHLSIHRRRLGSVGVAEIGVSELRMRRLPFSRSNSAHLAIVLDGAISLSRKDGERFVVTAGETCVVTNWSQFDLACDEPARVAHILMSEARLRARGVRLHPDRVVLDGPRTLQGPLAALVCSVVDPAWHPTVTASRIAERCIEDLIVGLLIESDDIQSDHDDLRAQLRARAIEEIALRHREQGLNPTVLARYLAVSLRHLQRSFEHSGTTIVDQIATQRAASAAELLAAPGGHALTVREIARATGFGSAFELRSAFRARYGVLPSDYRASNSVAPDGGESRANDDHNRADEAIVVP